MMAESMARLDSDLWVEELSSVLLSLRTAGSSNSGNRSVEYIFGKKFLLPSDFFDHRTIPSSVWSHSVFDTIRESIGKIKIISSKKSRVQPQAIYAYLHTCICQRLCFSTAFENTVC